MTAFHATRFILAATAAGLLVAGVARAQTATPATPAPATPPAVTAPAPGMGPGAGMHAGMGPGMHADGHHGRMHGHRMDTDRDGTLSRAELLDHQKRQLERFDQADANKDGKLSRDERRAFKMAHAGEMGAHHRHGAGPGAAGAAPATPPAGAAPATPGR